MRLRRPPRAEPEPAPNAGFDWREIVCESEDAAKAEAERQQNLDNADEAEWIYLRNDSEQWLARRTPRYLEPPKKKTSFWFALVDSIVRGP